MSDFKLFFDAARKVWEWMQTEEGMWCGGLMYALMLLSFLYDMVRRRVQ